MNKARFFLVLIGIAFALAAQPARAEMELLTRPQLEALFSEGLTFWFNGPHGQVTFEYSRDGTWSVTNPKGGTAGGTWRYDKRKLCREESRHSGGWSGLQKKQLCFGVKIEGKQLYVGGKHFPMMLDDEAVLARVQQAAPAKQQVAEAKPAESGQVEEQQALELKKLELERERLALEKEKLRRERLLLEQKSKQTVVAKAIARAVPDVQFGDFHALVIGIDDYKSLPKLKTALTDARAVAKVLKTEYGYVVHLLENPTRIDIIDQLDSLREKLTENDNLLIYMPATGGSTRNPDAATGCPPTQSWTGAAAGSRTAT